MHSDLHNFYILAISSRYNNHSLANPFWNTSYVFTKSQINYYWLVMRYKKIDSFKEISQLSRMYKYIVLLSPETVYEAIEVLWCGRWDVE